MLFRYNIWNGHKHCRPFIHTRLFNRSKFTDPYLIEGESVWVIDYFIYSFFLFNTLVISLEMLESFNQITSLVIIASGIFAVSFQFLLNEDHPMALFLTLSRSFALLNATNNCVPISILLLDILAALTFYILLKVYSYHITKTYLYQINPHKPHFYIVYIYSIHYFSHFCSNCGYSTRRF